MKRLVATMVLAFALVICGPMSASAGGSDALYGLNGVITCPADPFIGMIAGDQFDLVDIPVVDPVTDRVIGLVTGTVILPVRLLTGLADILTSPMTGLVRGPYSPDAYFELLPGLD
jgi:hypothetical protein